MRGRELPVLGRGRLGNIKRRVRYGKPGDTSQARAARAVSRCVQVQQRVVGQVEPSGPTLTKEEWDLASGKPWGVVGCHAHVGLPRHGQW